MAARDVIIAAEIDDGTSHYVRLPEKVFLDVERAVIKKVQIQAALCALDTSPEGVWKFVFLTTASELYRKHNVGKAELKGMAELVASSIHHRRQNS